MAKRWGIREVRMPNGSLVDLTIDRDRIAVLRPSGEPHQPDVDTIIEGRRRLVTPAFVDIHAHLDKAFTRDDLPPHDGSLSAAIESMRLRKRGFTTEDVVARATRLIRSSVATGSTRIRSHVDVDSVVGLGALDAVMHAASRCADICDVQVVPFPQEGVIRDPASRELMERAAEIEVHAIGGMPHRETDPDDQRAHVAFCFDLARDSDRDVDMHVDETDDGQVRTLEMVADAALRNGWEGRVTVGHVCSLAAADHAYADRVIAKCRDAGITVVANPATNMVIQGRSDRGLVRRGITRVAEFRAAGVNVCFGQDNVADGFYPLGRGDMLEIALLGAHAAHLSDEAGIAYALECITTAPARSFGDGDAGIEVGGRADFLLFGADSWTEALRLQRPPEMVFFGGRPVATTTFEEQIGPMALEDLSWGR